MNRLFPLLIIFSCVMNSCPGKEQKKPPFDKQVQPVSIEIAFSAPEMKTPQGKGAEAKKVLDWRTGAAAANEVRKKYLLPILDDILSHQPKCAVLEDDTLSFEALVNVRHRKGEKIDHSSGKNTPQDPHLAEDLAGYEEALQQIYEGHIFYGHPNASTLRALADIQKKYPCSEAGMVALLEISKILYQPNYLYYKSKEASVFWDQEHKELGDYIINNYPGSWQIFAMKNRRKSLQAKQDSDEKIELWIQLIKYYEDHDVIHDKYFILLSEVDPVSEMASGYYDLAYLYFTAGIHAGEKSSKETGRLDDRSVDLCQKGFSVFEEGKKKYPSARGLRYIKEPSYNSPDHMMPNIMSAKICYDMIHRLEDFKNK